MHMYVVLQPETHYSSGSLKYSVKSTFEHSVHTTCSSLLREYIIQCQATCCSICQYEKSHNQVEKVFHIACYIR